MSRCFDFFVVIPEHVLIDVIINLQFGLALCFAAVLFLYSSNELLFYQNFF